MSRTAPGVAVSRRRFVRAAVLGAGAALAGAPRHALARQDDVFREARTGEVPEGSAALVDSQTLQAIGDGLSWLAAKDWTQFPDWLKLQRKRLGLLILGGLFASVLLLF